MKRRELLRKSAFAGAVGLTGIAAYRIGESATGDDARGPVSTVTETATGEQTAEPPPESTPTETRAHRHEEEFDTIVDALHVGADPTGEEPISDLLNEHAGDDTLLSFPAGEYRLPGIELRGYDHLGIAAAQAERPTFVAPKNSCHNDDPHIQFAEVTDFLLEGIDFDFSNEGAGGAINVIATGDATVRDVTTSGTCRNQIAMFRMDIRNPDASGLVENLRAENGQTPGWMTGAYVGLRHSGEVTFRNCMLDGFTDNGLYGSAPGAEGGGGGAVHTEGSEYRNNNVSNIRLGTPGSSARGDTIVVENAPEAESINLRGIRFRRGTGQVVEDCEIRYGPDVTQSFGAVVFHADNGGALVRDSTITMDSDRIPAVQAVYQSGESDDAPTFRNLRIDGDASRGYAVMANGRDGTTFENCTIEQHGDHRDGIRIAYSDDCSLVDSRIDVSGYPLILRDSTLSIRNTTFVTPDGERHVDEMEAGAGDFRPSTWAPGGESDA
jgi:hypothetical protein